MHAIQQTAVIDSSRRLLRLDEPLPAVAGTGRVNITVIVPAKTPQKAAAPGEDSPTPLTDMLCGLLAHVGDISKEQIREERLQKWLS